MDYQDYKAGLKSSAFWFAAKRNLLGNILKKIRPNQNLKILNLGCGTGDDLNVLSQFGEVYLVDINPQALKLIPDNGPAKKILADACELPFADNSFDVIICLDVFEHIANDKIATRECHRLLKPAGRLVASVPAWPVLFSGHDRALGHYRRYSKKSFRALLSCFTEQKINYWGLILFLPALIFRLLLGRKKEAIDQPNLPGFLNFCLLGWLKLENQLISHGLPLPFGLSLIAVCQK